MFLGWPSIFQVDLTALPIFNHLLRSYQQNYTTSPYGKNPYGWLIVVNSIAPVRRMILEESCFWTDIFLDLPDLAKLSLDRSKQADIRIFLRRSMNRSVDVPTGLLHSISAQMHRVVAIDWSGKRSILAHHQQYLFRGPVVKITTLSLTLPRPRSRLPEGFFSDFTAPHLQHLYLRGMELPMQQSLLHNLSSLLVGPCRQAIDFPVFCSIFAMAPRLRIFSFYDADIPVDVGTTPLVLNRLEVFELGVVVQPHSVIPLPYVQLPSTAVTDLTFETFGTTTREVTHRIASFITETSSTYKTVALSLCPTGDVTLGLSRFISTEIPSRPHHDQPTEGYILLTIRNDNSSTLGDIVGRLCPWRVLQVELLDLEYDHKICPRALYEPLLRLGITTLRLKGYSLIMCFLGVLDDLQVFPQLRVLTLVDVGAVLRLNLLPVFEQSHSRFKTLSVKFVGKVSLPSETDIDAPLQRLLGGGSFDFSKADLSFCKSCQCISLCLILNMVS